MEAAFLLQELVVVYLTTLSLSMLYNVKESVINECGEVC
jgi:hypothetical protein